ERPLFVTREAVIVEMSIMMTGGHPGGREVILGVGPEHCTLFLPDFSLPDGKNSSAATPLR
ncbi:MAG: hypothetical protein L0Y58_25565, partial [Verrucomicrobia subdivision 3 bacterium]|nr:hypothetical protein [Limisphaerales bacterium]